MRHKLFDGLVGQQILRFIATGVDMTDLGQQHVEVFRREAGEAHNRPAEIDKPVAGERVLRQSALQGLIAIDAAPGVHEEFRRPTQDKAKANRRSLERVIEHAEQLLVVRIARLCVRELVEVDELIQTNQKSTKACQAHETSHQFELIIDRGIVNDSANPKRGSGVCAGGELASKPTYGIGFKLLVAFIKASAVGGNDIGKVIAVHKLGQLFELGSEDLFGRHSLRLGIGLCGGDEFLHHTGQCTSLRLRSRREIAHQLGVKRSGLSAGGVEAPVGVEVSAGHHQLSFHRNGANQVEEEGFTSAIFANDQSK